MKFMENVGCVDRCPYATSLSSRVDRMSREATEDDQRARSFSKSTGWRCWSRTKLYEHAAQCAR